MNCAYDPRYVPTHQGLIDCPRCGKKVLAGEFHLDHENPLTLHFVNFLATRPRVRFATPHEALDIAQLKGWIDLKYDYIKCLANNDTKLVPRCKKRSKEQTEADL